MARPRRLKGFDPRKVYKGARYPEAGLPTIYEQAKLRDLEEKGSLRKPLSGIEDERDFYWDEQGKPQRKRPNG